MTIELTYGETLDLLNQAIKERGENYVYQKPEGALYCQYFHDDEPGCIVGWVLAQKGLTPADLEGAKSDEGTPLISSSVASLEGKVFHADDRALMLLEQVQLHQDNQAPWGRALADAISDVDEEFAQFTE